MITVGSAYKAELNREVGYKAVILIHMDLDTGDRRFAMWPHDVGFGGDTFFGLGPVSSIDPTEITDATPLTEKYLVWFVQNDPDFLLDIQQNCRSRFINERLVFLNDSATVVDGESIYITRRRMAPGPLTIGGGVYMSGMAAESRFFQHVNRAPRTYSDADQKRHRDATDDAFIDAGKTLDISRPDWVQKSGLQ